MTPKHTLLFKYGGQTLLEHKKKVVPPIWEKNIYRSLNEPVQVKSNLEVFRRFISIPTSSSGRLKV